MSLLEIQNISIQFETDEGTVHAVDSLSMNINEGKTVCLVGESGCGKSVTALSILRLIQSPPGKITQGHILFKGKDLLQYDPLKMQKIRGNDIAMIFQDPMTSLNPVYTCGFQIAETLQVHRGMKKKEALEKAVELLHLVHIPDPHIRINEYPHQLSGGMRQRVMIAVALSCGPSLLIADEPTTALDVTVQAQIIALLAEFKQQLHMSILFITHDLGVVTEIADEVIVLYAGKIVERGSAEDIFENTMHPYTHGLLKAVPRIDGEMDRLYTIPGVLPDPTSYPSGCRFYNRCSFHTDLCKNCPVEEQKTVSHSVACFHPLHPEKSHTVTNEWAKSFTPQ